MTLSISSPIQTVRTAGFGYTTDLLNRTVTLYAGIVAADIGKAMARVPGTANTFRLALNNDVIDGRLEAVESRVNEGTLIGTVKLYLAGSIVPVKAADALAAGDYAIGAGVGEVRKYLTGDWTAERAKNYYCTEVVAGFATLYHV